MPWASRLSHSPRSSGGGFASGAQIYQYFINYGIWCLILPALTQGLYALFFWYGMRYAYKHKTYDYRSFSNSLYGRTHPIMSNLYEICYLIMIGTASAAAFATGGSTIQTLSGLPYWLCTLIVGAFIFVIALYGTSMVRKCASTLSVLILIGLVLVLVPNIIAQWPAIADAIGRLAGGEMPTISKANGSFGSALWMAVLYFFFQLASVSVMYQHMEPVTDVKQINRAAIGMFVCNFAAMELSIIGLLAVALCGRSCNGFRPDARSGAERRGRRRADPDHLHLDHPRFDFDCGQHDLRHRYALRQCC